MAFAVLTDELRIRQLTPTQRMTIFDRLPREYRDAANAHGLAYALCRMLDDEEIAAFERDHA